MSNESNQEHQSGKPITEVTITIDGNPCPITKGEHTVVELKTLGHVPLAYDLDEIKGKKPHQLPDDGKTNISGDEVFVSHPKGSGSSHD